MIISRDFFFPGWKQGSLYDELGRMQRQMVRLTEALHPRSSGHPTAGVFPAVNLTEDQEGYHLRAELPGVAAEALEIQVSGRNLSVSGERVIDTESEGVRYHRREREGGRFSRIVGVPTDIDAEKVSAKLENGILTVRLPKAEAAKPKRISVE